MKLYVRQAGHNRFFIDVDGGCSNNCSYCCESNRRNLTEAYYEDGTADLISYLGDIFKETFKPGKNGSLLTLGTYNDIFNHWDWLKDNLEHITKTENPIQISTKQSITAKQAYSIALRRKYETQITVFISCGIPEEGLASKFESSAPLPDERAKGIALLRQYGIPNCLLIKPFIPEVTDTSEAIDWFSNTIKEYLPTAVCVGPLYYDEQIQEKLSLKIASGKSPSRELSHPVHPQDFQTILPAQEFMETMENILKTYRNENQGRGIPLVQSTPCVIGWVNGTPCPTRVYNEYGILCTKCQECELNERRERALASSD